MKLLRNIIFSPLAFCRLFIVVFMSGYVVTIGWFWLKIWGFSRKLQHWVMGTWGRTIMFCLGIRIKRNELPRHNNFILMPNHRSYLDIFIVAGLIPAAMVGKAELKKWPFGKLGAMVTNSILVDRKNSRSLIKTMNKIKASVSQGIPVTLFPEGTTYKGPKTKKFKNGSFKIAAEADIPVIPMAIEFKDKEDAWVDKDTFVGHFFRQMGKPVTYVSVQFAKPISDPDYKQLQKRTKKQIESMLSKIQDF